MLGRYRQQILFWAHVAFERHDDVFSNRIDRRVGDLREELLEIVVHQSRLIAQARDGRVIPHRPNRVDLRLDHRNQHEMHGFDCIAEGLHAR